MLGKSFVLFQCDSYQTKFYLINKIFALLLLLPFMVSCHLYFNNPVDSSAKSYVGFIVTNGNKAFPQLPHDGEEILYPALVWSKNTENVKYAYEVSTNSFFSEYTNVLSGRDLVDHFSALYQYDFKKPWITTNQDKLWNLPKGNYWWRVNLKGASTLGKWGAWSPSMRFSQKLRMTEKYWKQEEPSSPKNGYRYYYDLYGKAEKEMHFIHFMNESEPRWLNTAVTLYNEDKRAFLELTFSDKDCRPESITKKVKNLYELGFGNRVNIKRKYKVQTNQTVLDPPVLMEEDLFSYESAKSKIITQVNRFKVDSNGVKEHYSQSIYKKGKQVQTHFYEKDPNDNTKQIENYYYDLFYHKDYPTKPIYAKYYKLNTVTGKMEYYRDYILDYNFPREEEGQVITLEKGDLFPSSDVATAMEVPLK